MFFAPTIQSIINDVDHWASHRRSTMTTAIHRRRAFTDEVEAARDAERVAMSNFLPRGPNEVYVMCLSMGNHDGLGETRVKELMSSCKEMGVRSDNIVVVDHE